MMFDRKLTIAVLLAVLIETVGVLLWIGAAAERLERIEAEQDIRRPVLTRLTRVETELMLAREQLGRIERKIDHDSDEN